MGTRCLTIVQDTDGRELVNMYRQMDGYPDGHGAALAKYLSPFTLINGIGSGARAGTHANGMHCLAAQLVAHFKTESGIGEFYLYAPGSRDHGEEYIYTVSSRGFAAVNTELYTLHLCVVAIHGRKVWPLYDGPVADFDPAKAIEREMKI